MSIFILKLCEYLEYVYTNCHGKYQNAHNLPYRNLYLLASVNCGETLKSFILNDVFKYGVNVK